MNSTLVQDPIKREAILDAAIQVFAKRGFNEADVQDIADASGVGKGTVYRYFGKKEELFLAAADACMKRLESHVFRAIENAKNVVELIRCGGLAYAEFFRDHPEVVEIFIQERAVFQKTIPPTQLVYREKNRAVFEEMMQRSIEAGEARDIDVAETLEAMANLLYGTVVCTCLGGSTERLMPSAEFAIELILRGVVRDVNAI